MKVLGRYYGLKSVVVLTIISVVMITINYEEQHMITYESTWKQYASPEEAGFSQQRLMRAKRYFEEINSTSAMLVHDGKVVFAWGDISENSSAYSIRKSFLSALYGIQMDLGTIRLDDTLGELEIESQSELTETELQATVSDLLQSRSGIYLSASEESRLMANLRPQRGKYLPGNHFYYNNWDFNVLGTIYNQQTLSDIFTDFQSLIANPIGMEDFSLDMTEYKYELTKSLHPAYLFRVSARDMARFGQLYLQNGKWGVQQIVPRDWIEQSTRAYSTAQPGSIYGYGYLWWVAEKGELAERGLYSALGRYGQSIDVLPKENMVFVHRVNADHRVLPYFYRVDSSQRLRLLELVLQAKVTKAQKEPKLKEGIVAYE